MAKLRERGGSARRIGDLTGSAGRAAFNRYGFAEAALVARWPEIAGEIYARHTAPEALRFPAGRRAGGTLHLRVTGAFAPAIAMVERELIVRVNRFLGRAAVARLHLRHADAPPAATPLTPPPPPPGNVDGATHASLLEVADPALRAALEALARALPRTAGPPAID